MPITRRFPATLPDRLGDEPEPAARRSFLPFTAYVEGWALYAERLAWEMGEYKDGPWRSRPARPRCSRAVRLVVDTGMHYKRWSRERAIDYMVARTGMTVSDVTREIERYAVMPGQACAYKIGMMKILELREKAKAALRRPLRPQGLPQGGDREQRAAPADRSGAGDRRLLAEQKG
ncbi:MAG: DUF885 family protein [Alphaproteobacteria bacterium]